MNAPAEAPRARVVVAWALYDLANTIYSAIVVTTFLPDLLTRQQTKDLVDRVVRGKAANVST